MDIIPGVGSELARIGETRESVEQRAASPLHTKPSFRAVYDTDPMLVITYAADDTVEMVEFGYSGGGNEVWFDGVQLTYRFMDDVVADLAARGHHAEPFDIGYEYPGFAIFSMASRSAAELDPTASDDDERRICEGVSIVPPGYRDGPLPIVVTSSAEAAWRALIDRSADDGLRRLAHAAYAYPRLRALFPATGHGLLRLARADNPTADDMPSIAFDGPPYLLFNSDQKIVEVPSDQDEAIRLLIELLPHDLRD